MGGFLQPQTNIKYAVCMKMDATEDYPIRRIKLVKEQMPYVFSHLCAF